MNMKNIFKSRIFYFVLGFILSCSICTVSAYSLFAQNIGYTPKDETWEADNTKTALDDLYTLANNDIIYLKNTSNLGIYSSKTLSMSLDKGYYLVIAMATTTSTPTTYGGVGDKTINLQCTNDCVIDQISGTNYHPQATNKWNGAYLTSNVALFKYKITVSSDNTEINFSDNPGSNAYVPHGLAIEAMKIY